MSNNANLIPLDNAELPSRMLLDGCTAEEELTGGVGGAGGAENAWLWGTSGG